MRAASGSRRERRKMALIAVADFPRAAAISAMADHDRGLEGPQAVGAGPVIPDVPAGEKQPLPAAGRAAFRAHQHHEAARGHGREGDRDNQQRRRHAAERQDAGIEKKKRRAADE